MPNNLQNHNLFQDSLAAFTQNDPHLQRLAQFKYQFSTRWWDELALDTPGIYILSGGRQIGKSTSCKLLIKYCLEQKLFNKNAIFYLPCDEIYDAKEFSTTLRTLLEELSTHHFLLIIDEVTFVADWDRVIKALADEGYFEQGLCILTGSDSVILKEAAMRFPGRRGNADKVDFHLYPLTFHQYVDLCAPKQEKNNKNLAALFKKYLLCGGYLRAINDLAQHDAVQQATHLTYEQWIRGDILKQGKNEHYLLSIFAALLTVGVSQISYSKLVQKIGVMSKETCIDYIRLLNRMDVLFSLQAFDPNKKQGFPRKDQKFHFLDPFILHTIHRWLKQEGYINTVDYESTLIESIVASHCQRFNKTFYFKGQGEVDVIYLKNNKTYAIEVKWANQLRANDIKTLKQFPNSMILTKSTAKGKIDDIPAVSVYEFLYHFEQ